MTAQSPELPEQKLNFTTPREGWLWMTHPDRNDGEPIPVKLVHENGEWWYIPFDTDAIEFSWADRDEHWTIVPAAGWNNPFALARAISPKVLPQAAPQGLTDEIFTLVQGWASATHTDPDAHDREFKRRLGVLLSERRGGVPVANTRGIHALKNLVAQLQETGEYSDEEGDETQALNVLYHALAGERLPEPTEGAKPLELRLCEQKHLFLRPDQLYIFTMDESCESCKSIAAMYAPNNKE